MKKIIEIIIKDDNDNQDEYKFKLSKDFEYLNTLVYRINSLVLLLNHPAEDGIRIVLDESHRKRLERELSGLRTALSAAKEEWSL